MGCGGSKACLPDGRPNGFSGARKPHVTTTTVKAVSPSRHNAWGATDSDSKHEFSTLDDNRRAAPLGPTPSMAAKAYATPNSYITKVTGTPDLRDYRVHFFLDKNGEHVAVSPWHDVPLRATDGCFNFICEIPKWTRKKFEISTKERNHPILQDTDKKGNLREYVWGDMMFNYGAFPQTWEDPDEVSPYTQQNGDDDPLDVIELSGRAYATGEVVEVKVLGVIAMIDSGETDWKVIAINKRDPMSRLLNDVNDVKYHMHGCIEAIVEWLRKYKTHKGVVNKFAFDGECKPKAFAMEIIEECHEFWKRKHGPEARTLHK